MIEALISPPGILIVTLLIYSLPIFKVDVYNLDGERTWPFKLSVAIIFVMWWFYPTYGLIPILRYVGVLDFAGWPEIFFAPVGLDNFWFFFMSSGTLFHLTAGIKAIYRSSKER